MGEQINNANITPAAQIISGNAKHQIRIEHVSQF